MRTERKATMMTITENIEMELFSSEESCVLIQTVEEEKQLGTYTSRQVSLNMRKRALLASQPPQMYPSVCM